MKWTCLWPQCLELTFADLFVLFVFDFLLLLFGVQCRCQHLRSYLSGVSLPNWCSWISDKWLPIHPHVTNYLSHMFALNLKLWNITVDKDQSARFDLYEQWNEIYQNLIVMFWFVCFFKKIPAKLSSFLTGRNIIIFKESTLHCQTRED